MLQPTGIAVMASVGIHALLGLSLPYWSMPSEKKSQPVRNVQLLQLTPTEQSRLPQLAPSPLPSIPNQLPALSSLPSSGASAIPSLPALPPQDSSLFNVPPITPLPSLGKISSLSSSPRQRINLNKLSLRNSPPRNDRSTSKPSISSKSQLTPLPDGQLSALSSNQLPPPPRTPWPATDLSNLPSVKPAPLPPFDPNQVLPPPPLPNQGFPPSTLPNVPLLGSSTGASGLLPPQGYSTSIATGALPATIPTPTNQASPLTLNQRTLTNNSGDTNKDFIRRGYDYLAQNQITSRPHELQISRNNLQKVRSSGDLNNGAVVVAVKVDERGKIMSDSLRVIGSSFANGSFDGDAKDAVQGHSFPATGKPEAYFVKVLFNNDSNVIKSPTGLPTPGSTTSLGGRTGSDNRTSPEKPSGSDNRTSTDKPSGSDNRTSTEKPSGSNTRASADKPSGLTEASRPTSTGTSNQSFVDRLRRDFKETPSSNSTEKPNSGSTKE